MKQLSDAEFAAVRDYLVNEAGLVFDEARRGGLSATVLDRMRSSGHTDLGSYLHTLRRKGGHPERQRLLDAVTVQETHFFRNMPQVEALRRRILPELLRATTGRERPLTIWSAGCSTGEEPYTVAMLLLELAPMLAGQNRVRILGTDLSTQALRAAGRATYTGRTLDAAPPMVRDRWFEPQPGGAYAVKPQARRLVELRQHNLVTDPAPFAPGEVDLILCRNVTIYFGRETTARLIAGFHSLLTPDGYLLLGHSETLWQVSDDFTLLPVEGAFVYRRSAEEPPAEPERAVVPAARLELRVLPEEPEEQAARPDAGGLVADAKTALAAGQYVEAAVAAAAAVAADPLLAPAYVLLGQARTTLGQDEAAVDPLRKAIYLDASAATAHFLLAGALSRTGQQRAAATSYRAAAQAVRAAPEGGTSLLDGRAPEQVAALCDRLAEEAAQAAHNGSAADVAAGAVGGTP